MYITLGSRSGKVWPLATIFCSGLLGFSIAITIILALIPVYLPSKQITIITVPDDNNTFYLRYLADADVNTHVSGTMEKFAELHELLGLGNDAEISEGYTQGTFQRRKRDLIHRRKTRTIKLFILLVGRYKTESTCNATLCQTILRTKVQTRIQQVGNIPNFPCHVRSVGIRKSFKISATFLGIIPANEARIGFSMINSLKFAAI